MVSQYTGAGTGLSRAKESSNRVLTYVKSQQEIGEAKQYSPKTQRTYITKFGIFWWPQYFYSNEKSVVWESFWYVTPKVRPARSRDIESQSFGGARALLSSSTGSRRPPSWFGTRKRDSLLLDCDWSLPPKPDAIFDRRRIFSSSSVESDLRLRRKTKFHTLPHLKLSPKKFQILYLASFLSGKTIFNQRQAKTASGSIPKTKTEKQKKIKKT